MRSLLPAFLFAAVLIGGCSQYAPLESREPVTIALAPVVNRSSLPQFIAPLSRNVRERLAHSRNWILVEPAEADAVLRLTIEEIERRAMARDPEDTGRPLSFEEVIRVSVEWDSPLPPPWGPEPVLIIETDQILYAQPSLVDAETATLSEMANRLADKLIQHLDWTP